MRRLRKLNGRPLPISTYVLLSVFYVKVSDPVQHSDGLNKYTAYRVEIRPSQMPPVDFSNNMSGSIIINPAVPSQQQYSAVLRRYSDFLWLYERLQSERAGAIVPPIPEKQPVGRFSPAFVEDRRIQLERFLRRVAVHPELQDSTSLDLFLRADEPTFQAAKTAKSTGVVMNASMMQPNQYSPNNPMMQSSPNKKTGGIQRWFAEAKTSMTGDLVKSPDDDLFDEIQRYINGLDNQMRNISHQASGLVRKGKEIANGLFEFGLAFNLLGQSEADALGSALSSMGETADRLSVLSAEHAEREMAQFEEPLQDYIKMIHSVKMALQRRHEKRLSFSTCLSEVESKQIQLSKLRLQIGSEAKAYSMEMSLRRAQEAADVARDEFADCSQRVLREVDRFKREKSEDMRRTVLDYIKLQVDYNKRMEQVWGTLIPKLEHVQSSMANNGSVAGNNNSEAVSSSFAPSNQALGVSAMPSMPTDQAAYANNGMTMSQQQYYPNPNASFITPMQPQYSNTMQNVSQQQPQQQLPFLTPSSDTNSDPMMNVQYRDSSSQGI